MARYRRRPPEVEARQVQPGEEGVYSSGGDGSVVSQPPTELARGATLGSESLILLGPSVTAEVGDWLVTDAGGRVWVIKAADFDAQYEAIA